MAYKSDEITAVLKELKSRHVEINACMVAKKGLEGVIMFPESFKQDVSEIWEPLSKTIDKLLVIISEDGSYNLARAYLEMLGYGVLFHILPNSDTALVVFIQCREKLDVMDFASKNTRDILAARDEILGIIEK